jgi:hypothetical protein
MHTLHNNNDNDNDNNNNNNNNNNKHFPYHTISVVRSIYLIYTPNDLVLVRPLMKCAPIAWKFSTCHNKINYETCIWYPYIQQGTNF